MQLSSSRLFDRFFTSRISRNRHSGRPDYLRRYALTLEPLETRHMLSVVGLDVTLYEDIGGSIGNEITSDTIQQGQSFFVQITVEDLRESPTTAGITGVTLDVNWDADYLTEIDSQAAFDNMTAPLVTAAFPELRDGTLNNTVGTITDLTGQSSPGTSTGTAIGADGAGEFSLLHFTALDTLGSTYIDVDIDSGSVVFADGTNSTDEIHEGETFSVVAAPVITIGDHTLAADTAGQQIEIYVSGGQDVSQLNFYALIADGGSECGGSIDGPAIEDIDLMTGTIFDGNNDGEYGDDDGSGESDTKPQYEAISIDVTSGTVTADGLLATLTIDTTGFTSGTWTLNLVATDMETNFGTACSAQYTLGSLTINTPPTANDADDKSTDEDTVLNGSIADSASDPDEGDTLTFAAATATSANGAAVTVNADGTFSYDPTGVAALQTIPVGTPLADTFDYTVTDSFGETSTATVTVTVTGINDAPTLEDGNPVHINQDQVIDIDLRQYAEDWETADSALDFAVKNPQNGTVTLLSDGHTARFTPSAGFSGLTNFKFDVTDTGSGTAAAETVEMIVNLDVNQLPQADGDLTVQTQEDTYVDIDLWEHVADTDTADADLVFALTDTASGQAVMLSDGHTVRFTPSDDFNGSVSFKFSVTETNAVSQTPQHVELTMNVDVTAVNDAPTAADDTGATTTGTAIDSATQDANHSVLDNDTDIDGDTLTVTPETLTSARGAAVTIGSDGNYTYDPSGVSDFSSLSPGESLTDTFEYTVSDGNGGTDTATVTITVYATATEATALDDTAETDEDTSATGNVLTNDQIASTGLTLTIKSFNTTSAKGASISIDSNGNFIYDPSGSATLNALGVGETTTDTFSYTVKDENGNESTATVTVTITGVNDAPTAADDTRTVDSDKTSAGNVVNGSDTDPDTNDVITVVPNSGTTANGATFTITENGSFIYDPTASDYIAGLSSGQITDSFTYEISDGNGGTDTASVTFTVNCVNDAPTANDDTGETNSDTPLTGNVLDNDTDPDTGDSLSVGGHDSTSDYGAAVTINSDGSYTYDPSESTALKALAPGETVEDTFTYTVKDQDGKTSLATVTITVTGVDDAPTAADDTDAGSTDEDTPTSGSGLFDNDVEHDPDDSFSLKSYDATSAKGAAVTVDASGNFTYDPSSAAELQSLAVGETTTDTFTYTIEDEQGNEATATVTITVSGTNETPTAVNDTASTNKDMPVTGNVLDNDTDPDTNDTLIVTTTTITTSNGASVTFSSDGSFTYDPANWTEAQSLTPGQTLQDTFTYSMSDGNGGTDTATVTVTVSGDQGVPVANDDTESTDENTQITGNVLTNDQVPTGGSLTVTAFDTTSAQGASVTVNSDGSFTYNPIDSETLNALGNGQSLTDTFEYTISDGNGHTDTATVTITVTGVADEPVISANTGATVAANGTVDIDNGSLRTTDPDSATADLVYTLTELPSYGTLKRNGVELAVDDTFTQADIDSGLIEYTNTDDSAAADLFKFTVSDGTTTLDVATFNLTLALNSISGFVYVDSDNDGVKDSSETGLASVNVILTGVDDSGGAIARSVWTAADGSYTFEGLPAGVYELSTVQPENFVNGKETAGSEGGTVANGRITDIDLAAGDSSTGNNFGQTGLQKKLISRQLFLASTPSTKVVFQNAVGSNKTAVNPPSDPVVAQDGTTLTVTGSAGDDTVEFYVGSTEYTLTVNGEDYVYNVGDVAVFNFNMGEGTDFVTLYGSDDDENGRHAGRVGRIFGHGPDGQRRAVRADTHRRQSG